MIRTIQESEITTEGADWKRRAEIQAYMHQRGYESDLNHPEINYVSGLTESNYTKYSSTAYRRHIGNVQQIAGLLYMRYGIKIQIRKPRQRKAA